ncbi:MAG: MFS transporter [Oscillospiraceae bacterium]
MKKTKVAKKIWILVVFSVFIAIAMSFVSWLIYAVFAESYRDIKQQYYSVVSRQVVEDIENSVKNGKDIERFYGMDKKLNNMLDLISTSAIPVNTAITDSQGVILYTSYALSQQKSDFDALVRGENTLANIRFDNDNAAYRIVNQNGYDVMIQPIYDTEKAQIGSMVLFYESEAVERELLPQKQSSNYVTMVCAGSVIFILLLYFILIPRSITEDVENAEENTLANYEHKQRQNRFMFVIPVVLIMAGLMVQCFVSYNFYQKRYRDVMFEGATGISRYLGEIIDDLNSKGVPYEKMNGLAEYLSTKVKDSPLLWNVSIVNVYADTSGILSHDSEYNVSMPIGEISEQFENMHINVEISKEYIDNKMINMLLVFVVAFAVAILMIYELLKLPDSLFARMSKTYSTSKAEQAKSVAPAVRLGAFIAYTGLYAATPFSAVLISHWNKSLFGLSVSFLASVPMTAELLATMLCSLLLLPVYKRLNLKLVFSVSALLSVAANIVCFVVGGPAELIVCRFVSGIGFAGIKYSLNSIVSQGSDSEATTTDNLAALNAGLLGGITCGASLGAIIASSISVQTTYLIAGVLMASFILLMLALSPWKLIAENTAVEESAVKKSSSKKKGGVFSLVFNFDFLRYALLVAVPLNFGLMFIVAFFPGFVTSLGLPEITTSYGYLINGMIGIYAGPKLLKALSQKIGRTACVFITLVLAAVSVLILNIDLPLIIVLVSVGLLGLFDGFGTPASSDYYVNMPSVKRVGVNQGLAVLNVIGSIIQTFSPILYSVILAGGNVGITVLGIAFGVCAFLFAVTSGISAKKREKQTN